MNTRDRTASVVAHPAKRLLERTSLLILLVGLACWANPATAATVYYSEVLTSTALGAPTGDVRARAEGDAPFAMFMALAAPDVLETGAGLGDGALHPSFTDGGYATSYVHRIDPVSGADVDLILDAEVHISTHSPDNTLNFALIQLEGAGSIDWAGGFLQQFEVVSHDVTGTVELSDGTLTVNIWARDELVVLGSALNVAFAAADPSTVGNVGPSIPEPTSAATYLIGLAVLAGTRRSQRVSARL